METLFRSGGGLLHVLSILYLEVQPEWKQWHLHQLVKELRTLPLVCPYCYLHSTTHIKILFHCFTIRSISPSLRDLNGWLLIIGLLRWVVGGIIVGLRGLVVVVVVITSQLLLLLRTARLSIRRLLLTNYWILRSCTGGWSRTLLRRRIRLSVIVGRWENGRH